MPLLGLLLVLGAEPATLKLDFQQDLRGRLPNDQVLRRIGPFARQGIKAEPAGLRITVPGGHTNAEPTGLATRFGIRGDFEITVAFALLQADRPTGGRGLGLTLELVLESESPIGLVFGRLRRPKEGDVFAIRSERPPTNDEPAGESPVLAARTWFGKLRVQRMGSSVSCLAADGKATDLQEVGQVELGRTDVRQVRVLADTGGAAGGLSVRLGSLRIRAEELPKSTSPPPATDGPWLFILVLVLDGAALGGLYWWLRPGRVPAPGTPHRPGHAAPARHSPD